MPPGACHRARALPRAWVQLAGLIDQPIDLVGQGGKIVAADCDAFLEEMVKMASSCPGIGLMTTIGSPFAIASEVVSPPGLPTNGSAAAISSSISVVKPSRLELDARGFREPGDHLLQAGAQLSLRPQTTTTCAGRDRPESTSIICSTGPTPNPPAETRIVNWFWSRPCLRSLYGDLSLPQRPGQRECRDVTLLSGTPSATRWTFVSSRATKYCSV